MNNEIRISLISLFPEFKNVLQVQSVLSDSSWNAPLSTGKLLELASLLFVCKSFKSLGATLEIPDLYSNKPHLFYLRNEIPLQHSAQAGHSATLNFEVELVDRYIAAFTPKVIIKINNKFLYIMREGNPIHELEKAMKYETEYKDRPDIGIYSGEVYVSTDKKTINVISKNEITEAHFSLEARNTTVIPLISYHEKGEYHTTTNGIIECSTNKNTYQADSQLKKYIGIFDNHSNTTVTALFVNGGENKSNYLTLNVDMNDLINSFSSLETKNKILKFIELIV
uniref:hypothetical protein n=1 Tax=Psychrobacter sp. TaxID=56811 RepID=UPI0015EFA125|nr:hypothetical protein [Psychrobacter sp.]